MNKIYTTQFGEANFPHLNKPDTQFNSQGIYQVKLLVKAVDAEDLIVHYNNATGLFSNKDKSMGFNNVSDARKWNETFKATLSHHKQTQDKTKVKPKVTINFSKINFEPLPLNKIDQKEYQTLDKKLNQLEQEIICQQQEQRSQGINGLKPKNYKQFNKQI